MRNNPSNAAHRLWRVAGSLAAALVTGRVTLAKAQANYSAKVLYPLTLPSGYQPVYADYTYAGQTVETGEGTDNVEHAFLWSATGGAAVDISPTDLTGINSSYANSTDGAQQVGDGIDNDNNSHALLWSGTAGSAVDLSPTDLPGIDNSFAIGIGGGQQVGDGYQSVPGTIIHDHALLWSGTGSSAVDLSPAGFISSEAYATDGTRQVGAGYISQTDSFYHALLWSGSAKSAVDLNPTGFAQSYAEAIDGNQQVGEGTDNATENTHALLWTGTAQSAVDLNPAGFTDSVAMGTNGVQQVGDAFNITSAAISYAYLWTSTAASAVDLQPLLPSSGTWTGSGAETIDSHGNVFGIADGTFNGVTGEFAVEWSPVPEPGTLALMAVAGGMLVRRRRMR